MDVFVRMYLRGMYVFLILKFYSTEEFKNYFWNGKYPGYQ